jgi:prefoldin subunit 5
MTDSEIIELIRYIAILRSRIKELQAEIHRLARKMEVIRNPKR